MHKGLGAIATVLIQNGSLKLLDPFVFGDNWGKVKTMHDQNGASIEKATPSMPAKITGLSNLAEAGCEFIVLEDEKKAKEIAKIREQTNWTKKITQAKKIAFDKLIQQQQKKILPLILKADMQGSIEALIKALKKIETEKVELNIISADIGKISESDIHLSSASNAPIIGFHTQIESHADFLIQELKIKIYIHDIIYHAIDSVKKLMLEQLDKIEKETDTGQALIKTIFKSSQLGKIAGCVVVDGILKRSQNVRLLRDDKIIYKGKINSIKKEKEDIKEIQKGKECGIILEKFSDIQEKDIIQAYDISYISQEL
jgi:translation initiation factor IF-2